MTRICIVSGDMDRRQEIKAALTALPHSTIAGEISGSAALRLLAPLAPDVILLDAETPGINPFSVLHMCLPTPVVVLAASEHLNEQHMFEAWGAHAVVSPNQLDKLSSIVASIVGQPEPAERVVPQQRQPPRRHWTQHLSTIFTGH